MTKEREIEVLKLILVGLKDDPKGYFFYCAGGLCETLNHMERYNKVGIFEANHVKTNLRELHTSRKGKMDNDGFWFPPFEAEPRIKLIEERIKILQS